MAPRHRLIAFLSGCLAMRLRSVKPDPVEPDQVSACVGNKISRLPASPLECRPGSVVQIMNSFASFRCSAPALVHPSVMIRLLRQSIRNRMSGEPVMSTTLKNTAHLSESAQVDSGSVQPFTRSQKIYVQGSRPDIRVPMREITLDVTPTDFGGEINAPVTVYDTSGPYTDPNVIIDVRKGLADVRSPWIDSQRHRTPAWAEFQLRPATPERRRADRVALCPCTQPAPRQGRCQCQPDALCAVRASSRPRWNTSPSAKT